MVIDIPNIPELIAFINKLVPNIKIELEARSSVYSLEYTKFNGVENLEKIRKFIEKEVSEEKLEELAKLRTANTSNSNKNTITRRALLMNISSIINAIRDPFKQKMNRNINTFAVAFIDLDNFKKINDTLGHKKGDLLLKTIAQQMQELIHSNDLLGRLGGRGVAWE
jgi:PleD family two-component response regulator